MISKYYFHENPRFSQATETTAEELEVRVKSFVRAKTGIHMKSPKALSSQRQ